MIMAVFFMVRPQKANSLSQSTEVKWSKNPDLHRRIIGEEKPQLRW